MSGDITVIFKDAKGILHATTGNFTVSEGSFSTVGKYNDLLQNPTLKELAEVAIGKYGKDAVIDPKKPPVVPNLLVITVPGFDDKKGTPRDFDVPNVSFEEYTKELRDARRVGQGAGIVDLVKIQTVNSLKITSTPTP